MRYIVALVVLFLDASAPATVLTGPIVHLSDMPGVFVWGDGEREHEMRESWTATGQGSGIFYGYHYRDPEPPVDYWETVDVYDAGVVDPLSVSDASVFDYSSNVISASEGETLFFRGVYGYYGAWVLDDISDGYLEGKWYFQGDTSGNFTPEPATGLLISVGLVGLAARRGRTPLRGERARGHHDRRRRDLRRETRRESRD